MTQLKEISPLLIEDNPGDARLIEEYLKESFLEFQHTVEAVSSLEKGIDILQDRDIDVILLDLSLPDSFGLQTFEEIQAQAETVPIIVLTGLDDEELGIKAVRAGAQDFLTKKRLNANLLSRSISYAIQRNRLNRQLEKSEERLREAQRLAQLGNYELNLKTGEHIWSDEIFRIFDMDPDDEEPTFDKLMDMIHPEDRNRLVNAIEKVWKDNKRQHLEIRIFTNSGKEKCIYNILNPQENKECEVVKIFGTTHNITERKKAEESLKEHERRYRMLFQGTTDEILVFQVDDNMEPLPFLEVNDIACEILGYSREELLQKTVYDVVDADDEEIRKRIADVISEGGSVRESQHLTKEGDAIPLEVSARSFKYNGRRTILSIGRDVRERRKLEQQILNISEQERQRIGQDMHDGLGQMLTGVGLIAQNLAQKLDSQESEGADQVQDIADMVKEADEHARALARGLVPVNIESNGLDNAMKELIKKSEKMYDVDIHYSNNQNMELGDNSSAVHLYRIAQEAINNAIKHGKPTTIDVELNVEDRYATLSVEDNGSGFPESKENSDGMGVRIMNFRAQMIGGTLEINSATGSGTEIICRMPLANN